MADAQIKDPERRKKFLILVLKVAVTFVLCFIIFWKANWEEIKRTLLNADPILIAVVLICMVFNVTISTVKWNIVLSVHKIKVNFAKLHQYYFAAIFFNNFLPTNIGGDGYRIYKTIKNSSSKSGAVMAVLTERVTGILALIFLGFLGGIYLFNTSYQNSAFLSIFLWLSAAVILISIGLSILIPKYANKFSAAGKMPEKVKTIFLHVDDYRNRPLKVSQIVLISIFFQVFTLFWMNVLVKAVGGDFSVSKLAVTVMISNLAAVLPISINGIGLLDGSFVFVAGKFGMNYEHAVMVMVLNRALLIPLSLVGGWFYLRDKKAQ